MLKQWIALGWLVGLVLSSVPVHAEVVDNVPTLPGSITIDGELNEPLWQQAKKISINNVTSPYDNTPSPIVTYAYIFEDGEQLYVAFVANDPNPENIQAFLRDRDNALSDDLVGIKLDTFNDHRLAYKFYVNALGVQNDGIENVMAGTNDNLWDATWASYGKITDTGYVVEIAIPFNILNFEDSSSVKTWAIELFRMYPRNERLRISNITLDRNNDCWVCQMQPISGFKQAKLGKNFTVTPNFVARRQETKPTPEDDWQSDSQTDVGVDLRWGINSNTLLNATINPDFSAIEADAGQLTVNKNFSVFYDEKRAFFLDNADYFTSNLNLVYTRNIADPDYGAKLTGRNNQHSYGFFIANDNSTSIIVPGNINSDIGIINDESTNTAFKYRYDVDESLAFGFINTIRTSDDYYNVVSGVDGKFKISESDTLIAQALVSTTEYPTGFADQFCYGDTLTECSDKANTDVQCEFGNCQFTELFNRSNYQEEFSGTAFNVEYTHDAENWLVEVSYEQFDKDFRADLGFIDQVDNQEFTLLTGYKWYGELDDWWYDFYINGQYEIEHTNNGELLEKSLAVSSGFSGPMLSYVDILLSHADKTGKRHNESLLAITNNSTLFTENQIELYGDIQPHKQFKMNMLAIFGDKIDYTNNRLGKTKEASVTMNWNVNQHIELNTRLTSSILDADNANVFKAHLADVRLSYQFDVQSYLKLNIRYRDVERNFDNYTIANPEYLFYQRSKNLATQLVYSYKVNPQTVFFLGYSDNSFANDIYDKLERDERTVFLKLSYAWMQ